MNSKPLLSVHLLTYNCENYIEDTLKSILGQKTDFTFEIVIGDDNSTDNTHKILKFYAEKYPKIINYQKNETQLGILKNFKKTLDRCLGDYIFDIAGDDYIKKNDALQKMVEAISKNANCGFIDSGYDKAFIKSGKVKTFVNKPQLICSKEEYKQLILKGQVFPIGVCYNREHLIKFVDFDRYINMKITIEDYPILVDLVMNTDFDRIDESLHEYRIHKNSNSRKLSFELQFFLKNEMLRLVTFFHEKYNLPSEILTNYQQEYHRGVLNLSGRYGQKELGKKTYIALSKPKKINLIINYLCSQNIVLRKTLNIFRKL